jgi:hypothetical protein
MLAVAVGQQFAGQAMVAFPAESVMVGGTEYVAVVALFKYTETTLPWFTVTVKFAAANATPEINVPPATTTVGAVVYPEPTLVTRFNAVGPATPTVGATV